MTLNESLEFLYRLTPTRSGMLTEGPTDEEARTVGAHFHYLKDLSEQGVVVLAGRTTTEDEHVFGIVIFRAGSEEAAQALMESDPAVRAGVMQAELFPFSIAIRSAI